MQLLKTIALAGVASLLSSSVFAATAASIKDAPNQDQVMLSGTVEDFDSEHTFMLRDPTGTIKIDLSRSKPMVLKEGATVSVSGTVNHTLLGTDVVAVTITEDRGLGQKVGEALDQLTGQDPAAAARSVSIRSLPKSGLVKIDGVVESVASGKQFTIKDSTGRVKVAIKSGESASLAAGTEVAVVGTVDNGLLGKTINATQVEVIAAGSPQASP